MAERLNCLRLRKNIFDVFCIVEATGIGYLDRHLLLRSFMLRQVNLSISSLTQRPNELVLRIIRVHFEILSQGQIQSFFILKKLHIEVEQLKSVLAKKSKRFLLLKREIHFFGNLPEDVFEL